MKFRVAKVLTLRDWQRIIQPAEQRLFMQLGGYIRTTAKRSMRPGGKSGKSAGPGEAPRWHKKTLRNLIEFVYDKSDGTLIVGPKIFPPAKGVKHPGFTIPEILEKGGIGRKISKFSKLSLGGTPTYRPANYSRREYMQKAFRIGLTKLKDELLDFITKSRFQQLIK